MGGNLSWMHSNFVDLHAITHISMHECSKNLHVNCFPYLKFWCCRISQSFLCRIRSSQITILLVVTKEVVQSLLRYDSLVWQIECCPVLGNIVIPHFWSIFLTLTPVPKSVLEIWTNNVRLRRQNECQKTRLIILDSNISFSVRKLVSQCQNPMARDLPQLLEPNVVPPIHHGALWPHYSISISSYVTVLFTCVQLHAITGPFPFCIAHLHLLTIDFVYLFSTQNISATCMAWTCDSFDIWCTTNRQH